MNIVNVVTLYYKYIYVYLIHFYSWTIFTNNLHSLKFSGLRVQRNYNYVTTIKDKLSFGVIGNFRRNWYHFIEVIMDVLYKLYNTSVSIEYCEYTEILYFLLRK